MKFIKQALILTLIIFFIDLIIDFLWYRDQKFREILIKNIETIWIDIIAAGAITLFYKPKNKKMDK